MISWHWQSPPPGWIAVNTDGSGTSSGTGGVIRGSDGWFIKAFSTNLAGIAQGLHSAWETGARKVKLQTDYHPHYTMVSAIHRLLERGWEVSIDHVFREGNYDS
ncbi:unnamed protein product [Linum trigynum]|uniref:RNase H type-1 domain-containing protein n=1 Tax=Linum trigynum TaxID=586398 RepID=A0AAV2E081_9ROSI